MNTHFKNYNSRKYKLISMITILAMLFVTTFIMLPKEAYAQTQTVTKTNQINVNSDWVKWFKVQGAGIIVSDISAPEVEGNTKIYQVALSPNTSGSAVTLEINLKRNIFTGYSTTTETINLTNGATSTPYAYSHHGKTYKFNIRTESAYESNVPNGNASVTIPTGENMVLEPTNNPPNDGKIHFNANSTDPLNYPGVFSLRVIPNGTNFDAITSYSWSDNGSTAGLTLTRYVGTYYVVNLPTSGPSELYLNVSYGGNSKDYVIHCKAPGSISPAGTGTDAYLPAPGQFVNEGVTSGGWGDIYDSNGNLKAFKGNMVSTGVSHGYFGGYTVIDFGEDNLLTNDNSNPYGIDFIVYGNAFDGNSEPGCIQVSRDKNTWYDIAGSLHYDSATQLDREAIYTNPTPTDNANTNPGALGTRVDVPFTSDITGLNSATVVTNSWHNHSFFPLIGNYFVPRNGNPSMDKDSELGFIEASGDKNTITYKGVYLGGITDNRQGRETFGYFDCHSNASGDNVGKPVNPYLLAHGGGDGIDLAWAVNSTGPNIGKPVSPEVLSGGFRYVRVYNGVAKDLPPFGEISPELCGIYKSNQVGGLQTETSAPTVTVGGNAVTLNPQATNEVNVPAGNVDVIATSNGNRLAVNSSIADNSASKTFTLTSGQKQMVRIICKDSTKGQPYVRYLELTAQ